MLKHAVTSLVVFEFNRFAICFGENDATISIGCPIVVVAHPVVVVVVFVVFEVVLELELELVVDVEVDVVVDVTFAVKLAAKDTSVVLSVPL